jgi:alkylhydroperoxidase family enzyme
VAVFDIPSESELSPEGRHWVAEWSKVFGYDEISPRVRLWGRVPRVLEARVHAARALHMEVRCVSREARYLAAMLMAHARRCQACFLGSRIQLDRLGFDEAALDGICADPAGLPLPARERAFVTFALKVSRSAPDLAPADFQAMTAHGFSPDDVLETIGFVAFWTLNMIFSSAVTAALDAAPPSPAV